MNIIGLNRVDRGAVCVARESGGFGKEWVYDLAADLLWQYDDAQKKHIYKAVYIYIAVPPESFDSPEYILSSVTAEYYKKTSEGSDPSINAIIRNRVIIRYIPKDRTKFDFFTRAIDSENFAVIVYGLDRRDIELIKMIVCTSFEARVAGTVLAVIGCKLSDDAIDFLLNEYESSGLQVIDVDSKISERREIKELMGEWAQDIKEGNKKSVFRRVDEFHHGDTKRAITTKLCLSLMLKDENNLNEVWASIKSMDNFGDAEMLSVANIFAEFGEREFAGKALERIFLDASVVDEKLIVGALDLAFYISEFHQFPRFIELLESSSVAVDKEIYYELEVLLFIKSRVEISVFPGFTLSKNNPYERLACSLEKWWKDGETLLDIISLIAAFGIKDEHVCKAHSFLLKFVEFSKSEHKVLDIPLAKWKLQAVDFSDLARIYLDALAGFFRDFPRNDKKETVGLPYVFGLLQRAAFLVASLPHIGEFRERFSEIMSASKSGLVGPVLIALSAAELIKKRDYEVLCYEDVLEGGLYESFMEDLELVASAVNGQAVNLLDEFPEYPLEDSRRIPFLYAVNEFSQSLPEHLSTEDISDGEVIDMLLVAAVFSGKNIESESVDFRVIRNIATSLSLLGDMQRARDLAETILQLSVSGDYRRKRYAWKYFANIYARSGNSEMAALSMLCALSLTERMPWSQAFEEIYDLVVVLREINLVDFGLGLIELLADVAGRIDRSEEILHRVDFLSATLEVSKINHESPAEDINKLLLKVFSVCEASDLYESESFPSLHFLSQLVGLAISESVTVPQSILNYLDNRIGRLSDYQKRLINIAFPEKYSLNDLCDTLARTASLRYANDIGYDLRNLAVSARIYLGGGGVENAVESAFLCELLSDHSIRFKGGDFKDVALLLSQDFTITYSSAESFSRTGTDVVFMGRGANSKLAKLHFSAGALISHSLGWFDRSAYGRWSQKYPYHFESLKPEDCNLAFSEMDALDVGVEGLGRTVFVFDTHMKSLPPNLIISGGDFIGRKRAVCSAPSFTWLNNTKVSFYDDCSGEVIWIPTEGKGQITPTLNFLDTLIRGVVDSRAARISNEGNFPTDLRSKEMVILGGHGGLKSENGIFDSISSDSGNTRLYPDQIGPRLANTKLVILFICSGGRVDPHPFASSSLGIPQTILNHGCASVIAPTWPLDVFSSEKWLSTFLRHWDAGVDAAECNFRANRELEAGSGGDIVKGLNMHIYGCPDIRKNSKF